MRVTKEMVDWYFRSPEWRVYANVYLPKDSRKDSMTILIESIILGEVSVDELKNKINDSVEYQRNYMKKICPNTKAKWLREMIKDVWDNVLHRTFVKNTVSLFKLYWNHGISYEQLKDGIQRELDIEAKYHKHKIYNTTEDMIKDLRLEYFLNWKDYDAKYRNETVNILY